MLEIDLPPEFIVSEHARQRMAERFGCDERKIRKIAVKAWQSQSEIPAKAILDSNRDYRYYNGHIFVYARDNLPKYGLIQKILITVYNPKVKYFYEQSLNCYPSNQTKTSKTNNQSH